MTKEFLMKLFRTISLITVLMIALVGVLIFCTGVDARTKGVGIGIAVGVLMGGLLKIQYALSRLFVDKDERTIGITVLTKLVSESFFALSAYLCFVLTAAGVLHFNPSKPLKMVIYISIIIAVTTVIDKVAYRILSNKL